MNNPYGRRDGDEFAKPTAAQLRQEALEDDLATYEEAIGRPLEDERDLDDYRYEGEE